MSNEEVFKTQEMVELWSKYTTHSNAKLKNKYFCAYLKCLSKAAENLASAPTSLPPDRNPIGLLQPSVAFGTSNKALSVTEFPDVVSALDSHVQLIAHHLPDPAVRNMPSTAVEHPVGDYLWEQAEVLGRVLCYLAGFQGNYLHLHNKRNTLLRHVMALFSECLKLLTVITSAEVVKHLLTAMSHLLGFMHHVLDPDRRWKQLFIVNKDSTPHSNPEHIQEVPPEMLNLFINVFKEPPSHSLCPVEFTSMQMEMLHVIGAAATGLMRFAKVLVTPEIINQLLVLLHPSRNSGCGPMQALALRVFVKVLHVLHCFMPKEEQVDVDTEVTLSKLLSVLPYSLSELTTEQQQFFPTFLILFLDSISLLIEPPKCSTQLKEQLVEVGFFEKLVESFRELKVATVGDLETTLVCLLLRTFTMVLKGSPTVKTSFKQHVKYSVLKGLIASLATPTKMLLQEVLNMALEVTDGTTESTSPLVCNADALGLCLEWLLDLPHNLQQWLSRRVLDLCSFSVYNKQQCCGARLTSIAVKVLVRSQEDGGFCEDIEDNMLRLIEGLGTHSIMGTELKDILVSLQPLKTGESSELPTYYYKLQYVLSVLANKDSGIRSLYYFELRQPNSHIALPEIIQPNQYAFSFHCWVSLDRGVDQGNDRRMLYSFYAGSTGFEAFFTKDLVLVVAVCSKKRGYKTISVTEPLTPQEWHSVCVVYSTSKKHSEKVNIHIFLDGKIAANDGVRALPLANSYSECKIGWSFDRTDSQTCIDSPPPFFHTSPSDVISSLRLDESVASYGPATNLRGCVGPLCLFSDALQTNNVQSLHSCGPNDLSIFQAKSDDLKSKLILYYHPKACKDNVCVDLSPSHTVRGAMDGVLVGEVYVTRDIKLVLSSLGGVEVFFPILEQAGLPLKQRELYSITDVASPRVMETILWNNGSEAIAYLFKLLTSMLANAPINQQVFYTVKGLATIGALLQKVPPSLLTVAAHSAIQSFVQQLTFNPEQSDQQYDIYSSLVFNYRIWSRADYSVQLSHSKYLSAIVGEKFDDCRRDFGVQFVLDVIREYYNPSSMVNPKLSAEEKCHIRESLMSVINLYLKEYMFIEEVDAILGFLCAVNDEVLLDEILKFLLSLLTTPTYQDSLSATLWEKGGIFLVRIQAQDLDVRLTTIKVLSLLNRRQGHNTSGLLHKLLHSRTFAAALYLMHQQHLSSSVFLALLDLCIVKNDVDCTDYISNFVAYTSTLQLLRHAPLIVRHTSCLELKSLLDANSDHALKMYQTKGWERMLLWLLTPPQADTRWLSSTAHRSRPGLSTSPGTGPGTRPGTGPGTSPGTGLSTSPGTGPGTSPGTGPGTSPCVSHDGMDYQLDNDQEISKIFNVVMETIEFILWNSMDPMEANGNLRKAWSLFFTTVDLFVMECSLIVPAHIVKQRLLTLLLKDVIRHCSSVPAWSPDNPLPSVVLQLSQLLEAFVIKSYPSFDVEEDSDIAFLAFSHNPTFELHSDHCSPQLLQLYSDMLKATHVLERHAQLPEEVEVSRSYLRILMACTNSSLREYNVMCLNILQLGWLPIEDVQFIFLGLTKELSDGMENDQSDKIGYITTAMRCLFTVYSEQLELTKFLPNLPIPVSQTFAADLLEYSKTKEWTIWVDELKARQMPYSTVLASWLEDLSDYTKQYRRVCSGAETERKEVVVSDLESYERDVLQQYNTLRDNELTRWRTLDIQHKNGLSAALQKWSGTQRFLRGECGAWKSRDADLYLWKMDRTENASRMRLKLARNYNYNKHTDASQQSSNVMPSKCNTADTRLLAMATATKSSAEEEEEHLVDQIQMLARDEPSVALEKGKKEKLVRRETCQLVTLVEVISGTLDITNKCIYFVSDPQEKDYVPWYPIDFKFQLSQLRELYPRRYNMSLSALELFLMDRTNYFLRFPSKKIMTRVCSCVLSLNTPNLIKGTVTQKPAKLVQSLGLTQRWVKREITNFDYIMQINTISGRTYNDLNQYPIFPWILRDYTSDKLDLNNPEVFRDLSKPMGIQNPDLVETVSMKYEEFDDPVMGKFHYGTHYSSATNVIHYLVRLEPFTSLQIKLQSGRFDFADRQFFSIPNAWSATYLGSDVKELIPEFFCFPDFLRNINGYDFGVTQDKITVGDVILPKWASSPEDFIRQHRDALESEYVSAHLSEWIDLVFGYKQTGPEAEKAMNVFNKYSYQENVDLDSIEDERIRRKLECMINNFGQTPTRLFSEKHPSRLDLLPARLPPRASTVSGVFGARSQGVRPLSNWRAEDIGIAYVEVTSAPVIFLGTPSRQPKGLIASTETLVTVTGLGAVNVHVWQPYSSNTKQPRPYTLQPDLNPSKCPCLGGPFDKDLNISYHLFALSSNNKLLLTAGHWDNSFRTYSLEKNKVIARTTHHTAVVTCMAVDRLGTEDLLITGSKDTTCVIWKFSSKYEFPTRPLQTLYGHDAEVLCVDICSELDIAISGAKNGTCLVHTIRSGQLVHKLTPKKLCEIRHVTVSPTGVMLVYSVGPRSTGTTIVTPCLHLYSINGRPLEEKQLSSSLSAITVDDKYIISGTEKGSLIFSDLFTLNRVDQLTLCAPICSITKVLDRQSKVCTHLLVGLKEGKVAVLYPRDTVQTLP